MIEEHKLSIRSAPTDMRAADMQVPSNPSVHGDAGLRDCEPSPQSPQGQAAVMFDHIAEYIEEVRTSLSIDISDAVCKRWVAEFRSLRERRFDRVTQSL